jgi:hypothetical protein
MIIVAGAIHVRRHDRNVVDAILVAISLAKFDTGDLGDCIPLVGGLERSSEKFLFRNRLMCKLWIDA